MKNSWKSAIGSILVMLVVLLLDAGVLRAQVFSPPLKISSTPPAPSFAISPELAIDRNGNINVVWVGGDLNTKNVLFSRSSDGGRTFSPPLIVGSGDVARPAIEIDYRGNIYIVWDDKSAGLYDVFFSRSIDDGQTFSAPLKISTTAGGSSPELAIDNLGNIFVVWMGCLPPSGAYISRSLDGGQTFSMPLSIPEGILSLPQIAIDPQGNICIVCQGLPTHQVLFTRSTDKGQTFSTPLNLSYQSGIPLLPLIAINQGGVIDVAWGWSESWDLDVQKDIFFTRSIDGGLSFSYPISLNAHQSPGMWNATGGVSLAFSSPGNTYLAWSEISPGGLDIVVAYSADGAKFSRSNVSLVGGSSYFPLIAVDQRENLNIVWTDASCHSVFYGISRDGGHSFSTPLNISGMLPTGYSASIALDGQGIASVVFPAEGPPMEIYYCRGFVNQPPVAEAGRDKTLSVGQIAQFDGSASSDPDGTIASYLWDFGDGSTASGVTASHSYSAKGAFTVTLTVTDDKGATATDTLVANVVNAPPVAVAGPAVTSIVCESASFNGGGSYDPDGTIVSYQWDFGDGTGASGVLASHVYRFVGSYTVTLTVTDSFGAIAAATTRADVITVSSAFQILINLVASFNLQQGINNSLDAKLQRTREAQDAVNANQRQDAQNHIEAFINEVNAQRGKALTNAQADQLIYWARRIKGVIILPGC